MPYSKSPEHRNIISITVPAATSRYEYVVCGSESFRTSLSAINTNESSNRATARYSGQNHQVQVGNPNQNQVSRRVKSKCVKQTIDKYQIY